jgi:hypothetical protein
MPYRKDVTLSVENIELIMGALDERKQRLIDQLQTEPSDELNQQITDIDELTDELYDTLFTLKYGHRI